MKNIKPIPALISRQYVYQFTGNAEDRIRDVVFDDTQHGKIVFANDAIQLSAPIYHTSHKSQSFHGLEVITFSGISNAKEKGLKVTIDWKANPKALLKRSMSFKAGATLKTELHAARKKQKNIIPETYRVKNIHTEVLDNEFWGIIEFENIIKVFRDGEMVDEVFSLSCYDIKAEVINFNAWNVHS